MTEPLLSTPQDYFRKYYNSKQLYFDLPALSSREFGFGIDKKINFRHVSFSDSSKLAAHLAQHAPMFVSYSTAIYNHPSAQPMEKKDFLGADLVFDLDSPLVEQADHDHNPIFCYVCFNDVKRQASLLINNFLLADFGFAKNDVMLNYSGSKGFHAHIRNDAVRALSAQARRHMVEYVSASGLALDQILKMDEAKILRGPTSTSAGWGKRFYETITRIIACQNYGQIGIQPARLKKHPFNQHELDLLARGNWSYFESLRQTWQKMFELVVRENSVKLDAPVTFDLHRLIRLPNTLHGDTGFIAKPLLHSELDQFDPFKHAIAFTTGKAAIEAKIDIKTELGGNKIDLPAGGKTELPTALAVYLVCKQKAVFC